MTPSFRFFMGYEGNSQAHVAKSTDDIMSARFC